MSIKRLRQFLSTKAGIATIILTSGVVLASAVYWVMGRYDDTLGVEFKTVTLELTEPYICYNTEEEVDFFVPGRVLEGTVASQETFKNGANFIYSIPSDLEETKLGDYITIDSFRYKIADSDFVGNNYLTNNNPTWNEAIGYDTTEEDWQELEQDTNVEINFRLEMDSNIPSDVIKELEGEELPIAFEIEVETE